MYLVPKEFDSLYVSQLGSLAQKRLARGIQLNHTEAAALIASNLLELIRDGRSSVLELGKQGANMLGRRHVLPSVCSTLKEVRIEGTFKTGTHLVTVRDPISTDDGGMLLALYGSFLPVPDRNLFPTPNDSEYEPQRQPGAVVVANGQIILNEHSRRVQIRVINKGDRPIHIGSHYNFVEANPLLEFDRSKAYGYRLDIPSGTTIRLAPGDAMRVTLVKIGGNMKISGGNCLASGFVEQCLVDEIVKNLQIKGFAHAPYADTGFVDSFRLSRSEYAAMYGPTTGDRVRLGHTDLWILVEKDFTLYGNEIKAGYGRTLRDGMGQASGRPGEQCLDLVIANALILDYTGIYKADIGVKDSVIVGIGKAGNPDTMDGVTAKMVIGSSTAIVPGEGKVITAGGVDTHSSQISLQRAQESLASGVTTLLGVSIGASDGTNHTSGMASIGALLQIYDTLPLNIGLIGTGSDSTAENLREQITAGACGMCVQESRGATPATIDVCLTACDEFDIQCSISTDTLNESGYVESSISAFKDRTVYTYHTEGAGGGHVPDVISLAGHNNILPASSNVTCPFTQDRSDELLDMVMASNDSSKNVDTDFELAKSQIRTPTIAAEDVLHDIGAISIMNSGSQAMGRCGEVISCCWNTAHKNKLQRGPLEADQNTSSDNFRVKRYVSKYTINPAIAQGIGHILGSVEVGKLADIVIWEPAWFGTKPSCILKGGMVAWEQTGSPSGSIPTIQPTFGRPVHRSLAPSSKILIVSNESISSDKISSYGLRSRIEAVRNCRSISKASMRWNNAVQRIEVDPETYKVLANGEVLRSAPAEALPLSQAQYVF
ncbi:hypothetical protein C2857_003177 [Epichloe festucae Fl1]|uniref:Urease n=1 Tax=Epichloe festucae (strain Fl1) TaxID=877507 RepID=A0A7U3SMU5_EPIFF|nr:hypothetical protein C2857_003177 [Epichloe festucae Fl1]